MSQNKNVIQNSSERIAQLAGQAGIMLMTAAAVTGMVELPNRPDNRVVVPGQAVLAMATEDTEANNPLRREREESAPHYVNYSVTQRTPSRSGRQ